MAFYDRNMAVKLTYALRAPGFVYFIQQDKDNIFKRVREGDSKAVLLYLLKGGDPEAPGHFHMKLNRSEWYTMPWSLLHEAAVFSNLEIIRLLLSEIGFHNSEKVSTVLWLACRYGNYNVVSWLLLSIGVDVSKCFRNPVVVACENGHFNIVVLLLEEMNTISSDCMNENNDTLLHLVIGRGQNDGRKALHRAAEIGMADRVNKLLQEGHNVNEQDNHGMTSLHIACELGHADVVDALNYRDADASIQNNFGLNSVDVALISNQYAIASYLEQTVAPSNNHNSVEGTGNKNNITTNIPNDSNTDDSQLFSIGQNDKLTAQQFAALILTKLCSASWGKERTKNNVLDFFEEALRRMLKKWALCIEQKGIDCEEMVDMRLAVDSILLLLKKMCTNKIASGTENTIMRKICDLSQEHTYSSRPLNFQQLTKDVELIKLYVKFIAHDHRLSTMLGKILHDSDQNPISITDLPKPKSSDTSHTATNIQTRHDQIPDELNVNERKQLLRGLALLTQGYLNSIDLNVIYYMFASVFAYSAHVCEVENENRLWKKNLLFMASKLCKKFVKIFLLIGTFILIVFIIFLFSKLS